MLFGEIKPTLPPFLADYFLDPEVEEVLINGGAAASVRLASGCVRLISSPFGDRDAMLDWLFDFVHLQGLRLDLRHPSAGGHVDGRFRWHALLPHVAPEGPLIAVRRHRFDALGVESFAAGQPDLLMAIKDHFRAGKALVIAGATASGKSSLLAALLREEASGERIVLLETLAELPLCSSHWVRLVARAPDLAGRGGVTLARLLEESLRLRPDRLVIGEVRGAEARVFAEAALTGHGGVATTMHAGSPDDVLARLASLLDDAGLYAQLSEMLMVVVMRRATPRGVARVATHFLPKSSPKNRFIKPKKPFGAVSPAFASPAEVPP